LPPTQTTPSERFRKNLRKGSVCGQKPESPCTIHVGADFRSIVDYLEHSSRVAVEITS